MPNLNDVKTIVITRKTRLEELILRFNTLEQAKFYIEHMGADFQDYVQENTTYHEAVKQAKSILQTFGRVQTLDREFLPNFIFAPEDFIVVIGQDGLVVNTAKYLDSQPIIGVNPDPKRWDGVLLPFKVNDLKKILPEVVKSKRRKQSITMAQAKLNDGQYIYGVNDLFIGQKTHVSARYELSISGKDEKQSSSGIIVSTGLGSTGWLRSVITGATTITKDVTQSTQERPVINISWEDKQLIFSVREPFPSISTSATLVFGKITEQEPLIITSFMPENGVIFSDGVEKDYLNFNSGAIAEITIAPKQAIIIL